jgi:hypothetical protein
MTHAKHRGIDAEGGAGCEHPIEERDEHGEALEREALGAEVAGLDDLLEDVGADEIGEDVCPVGRGRGLFHLLLQPLPLRGVGNVHELNADAAAVECACLGREFTFGRGRGEGLRREILAQRVERGLQVAPTPEDVEDGIAPIGGLGGGVRFGGGDGGHLRSSD